MIKIHMDQDTVYKEDFYWLIERNRGRFFECLYKNLIWEQDPGITKLEYQDRIYKAPGVYKTKEEALECLQRYFQKYPEEFAEYVADRVLGDPND